MCKRCKTHKDYKRLRKRTGSLLQNRHLLLPPLDCHGRRTGNSTLQWRWRPALRGARVRWGKGGGGRGDLTDVHPGVEERRQGSCRRHAATAGGGAPMGFRRRGATNRVGLDAWMLLVGSVRPGDAPIRRIGDGRIGRRQRSVGRQRAVLARQGSEAAGVGRGTRAGLGRGFIGRGSPYSLARTPRAPAAAMAAGQRCSGLWPRWASAGLRLGQCGRGRAGAGRAFGLGPFYEDRFLFFEFIFNAKTNSKKV
jgi:hypothetical protein